MKSSSNAKSLLLIAACCFVLTSCSEEETPIPLIVGTWNFSDVSLDIQVNGMDQVTYFTTVLGWDKGDAEATAAFVKQLVIEELPYENSTMEMKADGFFNITQNGSIIESGKYSLLENDKLLKLTSGPDTNEYDVLKLTANELILEFRLSFTETRYGADEIPELFNYDFVVEFKK